MSQDKILTICPKKQNIYKGFWFLPLLDGDTRTKISTWEKITESDYQFLRDVLVKRKMKACLDDVSYIFNYFKFLKTVSVNGFSSECDDFDEAAKQLWSLIQLLKNNKQLYKISFQVKGESRIVEISSDKLLLSFIEVFKGAFQRFNYWKITKQYLEYLEDFEDKNLIQSFIKGRTGNKPDCVNTVLQQSVTMFKAYLLEFAKDENKKPISVYTIIGEVLEKVELIDTYASQPHYKTQTEYYRKKAYDLDMNNALKKTQNLLGEMFPPHFLIKLNEKLIT